MTRPRILALMALSSLVPALLAQEAPAGSVERQGQRAVGVVHLDLTEDCARDLEGTPLCATPLSFDIDLQQLDEDIATRLAAPLESSFLALVDGRGEVVSNVEVVREGALLRCFGSLPVLGAAAPRQHRLALVEDQIRVRVFSVAAGPPATLEVFGRPRLRSESGYDKARREATWKAYDSLFGASGGLLTKRDGGKFPHHRGLFAGWNKVRCAGKSYDFWHGRKGETIVVVRNVSDAAIEGPVLGRRVLDLAWQDAAGRPIVGGQRRLDVQLLGPLGHNPALHASFPLPAAEHSVELDGDAHHAGIQVRLSNEVAENEARTRSYLPKGAKPMKDDVWADAAWCALTTEVAGKAWGFVHMTLAMPSEHQYSVRPYGRFGSFCKTTLEPGKPQDFRVRVHVIDLARTPFEVSKIELATRVARGGMTARFEATKR